MIDLYLKCLFAVGMTASVVLIWALGLGLCKELINGD